MTLGDIIRRARSTLDDIVGSYLWSGKELTDHINDSIDELCEKAYILEDARTASITITGSSDISFAATTKKITKSSGGLLAAGFAWATKISISATASNDGTKTIVSVTDTEIVISESVMDENNTSAVLTATTSITQSPVIVGTDILDIDQRIVRIKRAKLGNETQPLTILRENGIAFMDAEHTNWENADNKTPKYLMTKGIGTGKARLWYPAKAIDTLYLTVFRRPLIKLSTDDADGTPEIEEHYHRKLHNGILKRAFSKADSETFDPKQAEKYDLLWRDTIDEVKQYKLREDRSAEVISPPLGMT